MSPTARSLEALRKEGKEAEVVEKYNAFTKRRKDLFNVIDIVAIGDDGITGIQATSRSNHSARLKKSLAEPSLRRWLGAGGKYEIWSWLKSKKSGRWEVRRQPVTLDDFQTPEEGEGE